MRIEFWQRRRDFPYKIPGHFRSRSEKNLNNNFKEKCPKKFFGPAVFVFDKAFEIFPKRFRKKIVCCPKKLEKCIFWKTFFSLKCSYGHVKCRFNKPAKKIDKRPKTSAQCLKMLKKFICFTKQFFFSKNVSIDTENAVSTGRPNFYCSITRNDPKKVNKMQKIFKVFFFELFPWGSRKQLESPADFFSTVSRNFSVRFSNESNK